MSSSSSWHSLDLSQWTTRAIAVLIAGVCVVLATLISLYCIYKHLRNYTRPKLQRCIVRILFMVPIYSICSLASLIWIPYGTLIDIFRDTYEAFLLHQFFALVLAFINEYDPDHTHQGDGGDQNPFNEEEDDKLALAQEKMPLKGAPHDDVKLVAGHVVWADEERVIHVLKTKPPMAISDGFHPISCCTLGRFSPGRTFLRWTKRCIMQFVIINPILAFTVLVLDNIGEFNPNDFTISSTYFWLVMIQNTSITIALYGLVLFYHAVSEELAPFRPIPKFLCVKSVILLAFWQSVLLSILTYTGVITGNSVFSTDEVSLALQDWLICIEMVFIAIAQLFFFGHQSYRDPNKEQVLKAPLKTLMPFMSNLLDVLLFSDIMTEAVGAFDPRDKTPLAPSERRKLQENLQRQHQDQEQQQPHQYYSEEQSARYV
jgi:hypothetical protein